MPVVGMADGLLYLVAMEDEARPSVGLHSNAATGGSFP